MWIRLEAREEEGMLLIKVSDNGVGLPPRLLEKLSERLENKSGPGGLTMVARKLEALYGDNYKYEARQNGWGLEMVIEIPRLDQNGVRVC